MYGSAGRETRCGRSKGNSSCPKRCNALGEEPLCLRFCGPLMGWTGCFPRGHSLHRRPRSIRRSTTLQAEAEYIDARPHLADRRNLLAPHGRTIHRVNRAVLVLSPRLPVYPPTADISLCRAKLSRRAMNRLMRRSRLNHYSITLSARATNPAGISRSMEGSRRLILRARPKGGSWRQEREPLPAGHGYSSLRNNFLCGFQICKPCRSTT